MSVSVRTRFEVFKRDRFTCSYCGSHPPDVLLEVDHVIPRAAGGSDEMDNLVTACWDCNRGKSDRLLEEGLAPAGNRASIAAMAERVEQAKQYMDLLAELQNVTGVMVQRVIDAWAYAYGATVEERDDGSYWVLPNSAWPEKRSIRIFLRDLPLEDVLHAVDQTAGRIASPGHDACRYFYGVCWRMIRGKGA